MSWQKQIKLYFSSQNWVVGWVGYEELSRARRVVATEAEGEVDNSLILLSLIHYLIANYSMFVIYLYLYTFLHLY